MTRIWKRHRRTAEEAAIDEALKKEREELDLEAFLPSYARATGFVLTIEEAAEDPFLEEEEEDDDDVSNLIDGDIAPDEEG